ncbi:hypothetical protein DLY41_05260 [Escherichia coli]|nr:hypothetical protein [Escherichia coli]
MEYSGGCGLDVLITKNKQAVMCHGLFIELIADIKKTNRKGWFFLGIFGTRVFKTRAQPFDLIGYKKLKPKIV